MQDVCKKMSLVDNEVRAVSSQGRLDGYLTVQCDKSKPAIFDASGKGEP